MECRWKGKSGHYQSRIPLRVVEKKTILVKKNYVSLPIVLRVPKSSMSVEENSPGAVGQNIQHKNRSSYMQHLGTHIISIK